jgi:hypothetical protein
LWTLADEPARPAEPAKPTFPLRVLRMHPPIPVAPAARWRRTIERHHRLPVSHRHHRWPLVSRSYPASGSGGRYGGSGGLLGACPGRSTRRPSRLQLHRASAHRHALLLVSPSKKGCRFPRTAGLFSISRTPEKLTGRAPPRFSMIRSGTVARLLHRNLGLLLLLGVLYACELLGCMSNSR